jgi:hypothetical protein
MLTPYKGKVLTVNLYTGKMKRGPRGCVQVLAYRPSVCTYALSAKEAK